MILLSSRPQSHTQVQINTCFSPCIKPPLPLHEPQTVWSSILPHDSSHRFKNLFLLSQSLFPAVFRVVNATAETFCSLVYLFGLVTFGRPSQQKFSGYFRATGCVWKGVTNKWTHSHLSSCSHGVFRCKFIPSVTALCTGLREIFSLMRQQKHTSKDLLLWLIQSLHKGQGKERTEPKAA